MLKNDYADQLERQATDMEKRASELEAEGNVDAAQADRKLAAELRAKANAMRHSKYIRRGVRTA